MHALSKSGTIINIRNFIDPIYYMSIRNLLTSNTLRFTLLIFFMLLLILMLYRFIYPEANTIEHDHQQAVNSNSDTFANAVEHASPSVVCIQTNINENNNKILGSGIIFDQKGHIVTNAHVIDNIGKITVRMYDDELIPAQLVGIDYPTDLAVLKIDTKHLPAFEFRDTSTLRVGDMVLAIGNPYGLRNTVTQGIISAVGAINSSSLNDQLNLELFASLIQTDASINPGSSGGALIDSQGRLVGINTAYISGILSNNGISFAIPSNIVQNIAQQLINNGKVHRGWIGVHLTELPSKVKNNLLFNENFGIYIQNTIRNSPAQKAGLLPGDIITKINNNATKNLIIGLQSISELKPNHIYDIEIYRDGERLLLPITVSENS